MKKTQTPHRNKKSNSQALNKKGAFKRKPARARTLDSQKSRSKTPLIQVRSRNIDAEREKEIALGKIRINKYIADSGFCSRRKADELVKDGVVKVNQVTVSEMGYKVEPGDLVTIAGDPISYYKHDIYILLNKPKDFISTTSDEMGRKTVMDIVKRRERMYPVGRLDRNTTGVMLLTNDGELTNRLLHPKYEIERTYNVKLDKPLLEKHAKEIARGVTLEDGKTKPCEVLLYPDNDLKVTLVLTEGKNHEVRRLFAHFGYDVKALDRKIFAGISTSGLKRAQHRSLTKKEVLELKKLVKII